MRKIILALVLVLVSCSFAFGQGMITIGKKKTPAGCSDAAYATLTNQNFETATTGYDNSETWIEYANGGTIEHANTTTPLRGTQHLKLAGSGSATLVSKEITANGTVWFHIIYRPTDSTPATAHEILVLRAAGVDENGCTGATQAYIQIRTDGLARAYHGTIFLQTDSAIFTDGTAIHLWLKYVKGTGANGEIEFYWSANGTRPSLANACAKGPGWESGQACSESTGNATGDVACFNLKEYSNTTGGAYFDQILSHGDSIGNVCD